MVVSEISMTKSACSDVPFTSRTHFDDLALDKFQASFGVEDAGFTHPEILVDCEQLLRDFRFHRTSLLEEYRIAARSARRGVEC